jgi:colicin import membrane protein
MKAQERVLRQTRSRGKWRAIALAFGFHALFLALIFFGVRWQTQTPDAIQVEIVSSTAIQPAPEPVPEPKVEPKIEPKPEPKLEAKPEPKVEPEPKPEIVLEKPKQKPPKVEKIEKTEPEAAKTAKTKEAKEKLAKVAKEKELAAREQTEENAQKMIRDLQKQAGATAGVAKGATTGTPDPNWEGRVKSAIKRNTVLPSNDIDGNPEAVFRVELNPDCSLRTVRLTQSSKNAMWDQAAERAIRRTDPFPKPAGQDCRSQETIGHRPE